MSATSLSSVTLSPLIDIRTSECNIRDRLLSPSDFNFYACAMCIFYLYHLHSDEPNPRNIAQVDSETNEIIFLKSKRHTPGTRALVTAANVSRICNGDPHCWKLEDCCKKAVSCCEMQRNARRASYKDDLVIDNRTCPEIWDGFVCFHSEAIGSFGATACPDYLDHYGASPQQGDLRLSDPPSGQGAAGRARTGVKKVPADLRTDSLGGRLIT
ncbi:hypothetical protein PoB_007119800 [Plakobranchus ocellatus]|uniref:G-protein coupled receptors family 2 profile 1 domain-containing protein n=1 Tax=Plakobranchus ocellatus TaxID=259542 RepID=A0AAV4DKU2_9GAST|nr:hypothetical protein PoB_007119800 [Plakobranchus ocellatus]